MTPVSSGKTGIIRSLPVGHRLGSTFIGTDRNGRASLLHQTRLCGLFIAAIAGIRVSLWE